MKHNGEKWRYYCVLCMLMLMLSTLINVIVYASNVSDSIQQGLTLLGTFLSFFLFIIGLTVRLCAPLSALDSVFAICKQQFSWGPSALTLVFVCKKSFEMLSLVWTSFVCGTAVRSPKRWKSHLSITVWGENFIYSKIFFWYWNAKDIYDPYLKREQRFESISPTIVTIPTI